MEVAGAGAAGDGSEDAAVHRRFEFLKRSQQPDGAWVSGGFGPATSVTSLAVMAFLAAGHVPGEPGPYREAIEAAASDTFWRTGNRTDCWSLRPSHGPMYCHGISTLMLAEVAGMGTDGSFPERTQAALARGSS